MVPDAALLLLTRPRGLGAWPFRQPQFTPTVELRL